jgi:3D (Asp-Asp-Asp) domain-containing protein
MANWQTELRVRPWALGLILAFSLFVLVGCDSHTSVEKWFSQPAEAAESEVLSVAAPVEEAAVVETFVHISVDGETVKVAVSGETVGDVLAAAAVELGDFDKTHPALTDGIAGVETITVTRVEKKEEVEYKRVYFHEVRRANSSLEHGVTRIVQKGKEGKRAEYYEVVFEDGQEVSRTLVHSEVVEPKVDRIVEYGTIGIISRGGVNYRFTRVLYVQATAYTAGPESTGKSPGHPLYGITFSGLPVQVGHIAVDPSVIPLLTSVYVEGLDARGSLFNGEYLATDTGSGIKGNRIDIYFENVEDALWFGRRQMKVYILD